MDEVEEVLDVVLPSDDEAAEVMHLGKGPLDFPSYSIAAQLASILLSAFATTPIGRDQLDAVLGSELLIEQVRMNALASHIKAG